MLRSLRSLNSGGFQHLFNNKTDTLWWHSYVEGIAEVHFQKGRIKFLDENGDLTKQSAPYPSVWIIYRGQK